MAVEYADGTYNIELLHEQLKPLGLPGYESVVRMLKRQSAAGQWEVSAPYLLVRCGDLNATQQTQLTAAITAHDPNQKTPAQTAAAQQAAQEQAELDHITMLAAKDPTVLTLDEAKTLLVQLARRQLRRGGLS